MLGVKQAQEAVGGRGRGGRGAGAREHFPPC